MPQRSDSPTPIDSGRESSRRARLHGRSRGRRGIFLFLFFCAFFSAGLYALFRSTGSPTPAEASTVAQPSHSAPPDPPATPRTSADAPSTAQPALTTPPARAPASPSGFPLRPRELVELAGRLVVTDEHGTDLTNVDGSLVLLVSDLEGIREVPIDITHGTFRTRVALGRALRCDSIHARGRAALPESPLDWIPFPANGELLVRARLPATSQLRVLAADTGLELDHVEVALAPPVHPAAFAGIELHPGTRPLERLATDARSPVELPHAASISTSSPMRRIFVRAPSYAWCEVAVEPARPGEHVVVLERGGDLAVHLAGHEPGQVLTLVRRPVPGGQALSLAMDLADSDLALIESLPAGLYQVEAFAHRKDHHGSLGLAHVDVRPGERAELDLAIGKAVPHERGPAFLLEGVVVIPAEWELASFALVLRAASSDFEHTVGPTDVAPLDGVANAWSFRTGELPFDGYDLTVEPCGHAVAIEPWQTHVRVEVPPPAMVRLTLRAPGGGVAPVELVGWRTGALRRGPRREVPIDPWSQRFEFRAPAGAIEVSPMAGGRPQLPTLLQASAGENELVLEVAAESTVRVELVCAGQRVLPPAGFAVSTTPVEGGQRRTGGTWVVVQGPGRYRVEVSKVLGFAPVDASEVEVPPDGRGRLVVDLQRDRAR